MKRLGRIPYGVGVGSLIALGVLLVVVFAGEARLLKASAWLGAGSGTICVIAVLAARFLNHAERRGLRSVSFAQHLADLERRGLVEEVSFRAVRAFGVEDVEDLCTHLYLELEDGGVLFLCGWHGHGGASDGEGTARVLPCTEFTVRRHAVDRTVLDIVCAGDALEPEGTVRLDAGTADGDWDHPEDGTILDEPYDALRSRLLGRG